MNRPEWLTNEIYCGVWNRHRHQEELDRFINEWTKSHTSEEITAILQKNNVQAGPVIDSSEGLASDPHIRERGFFIKVDHFGEEKEVFRLFWRTNERSYHYHRAPFLGEHNEYVFQKLLGLPQDKYERLVDEKVIY